MKPGEHYRGKIRDLLAVGHKKNYGKCILPQAFAYLNQTWIDFCFTKVFQVECHEADQVGAGWVATEEKTRAHNINVGIGGELGEAVTHPPHGMGNVAGLYWSNIRSHKTQDKYPLGAVTATSWSYRLALLKCIQLFKKRKKEQRRVTNMISTRKSNSVLLKLYKNCDPLVTYVWALSSRNKKSIVDMWLYEWTNVMKVN